ncbi:MAG: helix-turn-helix transcriptional regulator [Nitrososphaerota archaeon]|nr:helix-turn-helix transcriptional regulator [Nitrososphaerota archaeon]
MATVSVRPNSLGIARWIARLTQKDLAEKCKTSPHTIAMVEKGFAIPSQTLADRISQALNGIPVNILFPRGLKRNRRIARTGWVLTEKGEQALDNEA